MKIEYDEDGHRPDCHCACNDCCCCAYGSPKDHVIFYANGGAYYGPEFSGLTIFNKELIKGD